MSATILSVRPRLSTDSTARVQNDHKFCLKWSNLSLSVQQSKASGKSKTILWPQSGDIASGSIVALLGPSGSGKTSLLNCLARRYENYDGHVTVSSSLNSISVSLAFVPQSDALFGQFTVKETLTFASKLKNSSNCDHSGKITEALEQFDLQDSLDTKVSKLSGGQRRRVAICTELISSPDILILDEPTTGLDSTNAALCVWQLSHLAQSTGTAVICSIHQPNNEIFNAFSSVYLLSNKGHNFYFGPPSELFSYFEQKFDLKCPKTRSTAEFAIDVARGKFGSEANDSLALKAVKNFGSMSTIKFGHQSEPKSLFVEVSLLAKRSFLLWNTRNPLLFAKVLFNLLIALLFGFLMNKPGHEDGCSSSGFNSTAIDHREQFANKMQRTHDASVFIVGNILHIIFMTQVATSLTFPIELKVIRNETSNKWYSKWRYFVAKTIADLPGLLLHVMALIGTIYVIAEQIPVFWRALGYYVTMVATGLIGESIGTLFGTLCKDNAIFAIHTNASLIMPIFVFCGFFIKFAAIPIYFKPFAYLSYAKYAFENALLSQYGFNRCSAMVNSSAIDLFKEATDANDPRQIVSKAIEAFNLTESGLSSFATVIGVDKAYGREILDATLELFAAPNETTTSTWEVDHQGSYILQHFNLSDGQFAHNFVIMLTIYLILKVANFFLFLRSR